MILGIDTIIFPKLVRLKKKKKTMAQYYYSPIFTSMRPNVFASTLNSPIGEGAYTHTLLTNLLTRHHFLSLPQNP